jgi:molybdenum cofactor guanylyltransferase
VGGKEDIASDISCSVLAGGRSTRLGRNKIVENIGKRSLIERVISRLASFQSTIIIVIAENSSLPRITGYPEVKIVRDIYPGKGSLGGIYTGLVNSNLQRNIVVAGDMPFLNLDLLRYMVGIAEGFDLVVPRIDGTLEPLHAVYAKSCIAPIEKLIQKDDLKILDFYDTVKVRYVEREEVERYDPRHLSFFNINTEAELRAGVELANREDTGVD